MPMLNAEPLAASAPGITSDRNAPMAPDSPMRKQFYHKYLDETDGNKPESCNNSSTTRVRNMVFANKKERTQERDVCNYIVTKVLNQGNLTKITGITTKGDLEKQAR